MTLENKIMKSAAGAFACLTDAMGFATMGYCLQNGINDSVNTLLAIPTIAAMTTVYVGVGYMAYKEYKGLEYQNNQASDL